MRRFLLALTLMLGLAAPTLADIVHLVGGGALEGQVVSEDKGGLVVRTANGTTIVVPREQVREIERGASVEELHRARLRRIDPRDAEARYALGLWLKSLRRPDLARREFLAVLLVSSEHRFARAELGQVRSKGEWVSVDAAAAGFNGALGGDAGGSRTRALPGSDVREVAVYELGCSPELAKALIDARSRDRSRAKAARALLADLSEEPARLSELVRSGSPAGALVWAGIAGQQEAEAVGGGCHGGAARPELPEPSQLDPARLESLLAAHVEQKLAPVLKILIPELSR